MSNFISGAGLKGIGERAEVTGQMSYYYGLSDFWLQIFGDKDLVDSLLEVSTQTLGTPTGSSFNVQGISRWTRSRNRITLS